MEPLEILLGTLFLALCFAFLWLPWWALTAIIDPDTCIGKSHGNQISPDVASSLIRAPLSIGLMLIAFIGFVNLFGRVLEDSLTALWIVFLMHGVLWVYLVRNARPLLSPYPLWQLRKHWLWILSLALICAFPQWLMAISSNRWDEVAASSIHLTAANQFSEGLFPPRHNAFPDVAIKYHYGFTLLSGTIHYLSGFASNFSIDIASTSLWLLTFIFTICWMLKLGMSRMAAIWGAFALLLGGGLSWLYFADIEVYQGFRKIPVAAELLHRYDLNNTLFDFLVAVLKNQTLHLKNSYGDLYPLPFDIAIHLQQHAVALGIPLALVSAYLFSQWQARSGYAPLLFVICVFSFSLVFLGHAVFGGVSSISAGLVLGVLWLRSPTRIRFMQGFVFTLGVTALTFAHGGMMSQGEIYGSGAVLRPRDSFGFTDGSLFDFIHWNLASFGFLIVFALVSLLIWTSQKNTISEEKTRFLIYFCIFSAVSYLIPQLSFFAPEGGSEESTEVTKFFFTAHFGFALLGVFAVNQISKIIPWHWFAMLPIFAASAVVPAISNYSGAMSTDGSWAGIYHSPYDRANGRNHKASGEAIAKLKTSNRDVYYDFSGRERTHVFMNELLVYGGSLFTITATQYEQTGFGYLLSEPLVAKRVVDESRIARLLPGAAEEVGVSWLYYQPRTDLPVKPTIVRSRLAKLQETKTLTRSAAIGLHELHHFNGATKDLDKDIEQYWRPKIIAQWQSDWQGDGKTELSYFNIAENQIVDEHQNVLVSTLPETEGVPLIMLARLPGDKKLDLIYGRMGDGIYKRGKLLSDLVRQYPFKWRRFNNQERQWQNEYTFGFWTTPIDIAFIYDHDHNGFDSQFVFRTTTGEWFEAGGQTFVGAKLPAWSAPLPVVGHFGPDIRLGVWSAKTGKFVLSDGTGKEQESFNWGGKADDILLPGDYNGDGFDDIGIWQPEVMQWWVRDIKNNKNTLYRFGTKTSVPLPYDYNQDGKVDLAYWEPKAQKIFVSFDGGQSIDRTLDVPPHSIPLFVQMY